MIVGWDCSALLHEGQSAIQHIQHMAVLFIFYLPTSGAECCGVQQVADGGFKHVNVLSEPQLQGDRTGPASRISTLWSKQGLTLNTTNRQTSGPMCRPVLSCVWVMLVVVL